MSQLAYNRRHQKKLRVCQHMTLKDNMGNTLSYPHNDLIDQDPDRASAAVIRDHMRSYPINFSRDLLSIAQYEKGHYLVYDNKTVLAYTIIFPG